MQYFLIVIGQRIINNGLYRIKVGIVIDGEERKVSFRILVGMYLFVDCDFVVNGNVVLEYVGYRYNVYNNFFMQFNKKVFFFNSGGIFMLFVIFYQISRFCIGKGGFWK